MSKGNGRMRVLEIVAPGGGQEGVAGEVWPGAEVVGWAVDESLSEAGGRAPYDAVLASHVLQLVEGAKVVEAVRCWVGWLREGGELHLVAPDLAWACEQIAKQHEADRFTLGVIYGQGERVHRSGFTVGLLRSVLAAAGLKAKMARLGPYRMVGTDGAGVEHEVIARQVYVVGVKTTTTDREMNDRKDEEDGDA